LETKKTHLIQSIERAIRIIDCFDQMRSELSLKEISEQVGLNNSTVHGILNTLYTYSYIDKNPENSKYKLGLKFLFKANLVTESLDLKEIGHPHIKALTEKYQETTNLCYYGNEEIYCIDTVWSPQSYLVVSSRVGFGLPIHSTASGKMILASLPSAELDHFLERYQLFPLTENTITERDRLNEILAQINRQGYSTENEEVEQGVYSIATPIRNHRGRVFGTISLSGPVHRVREKEAAIIIDLIQAAAEISKAFGCK
jgi:DNA-binding IclR family transcriptional regulator